MNENELIWLGYMLKFSKIAVFIVQGKTRTFLEDDIVLQLALAKAVELIGEAASKISRETRARNSTIPWRQIIGMRNVLAHDYFNIQLDIVWDTVTNDLPSLISTLEILLHPDETFDSD